VSTVVVTGVSGALGRRVAALLAARPDVERVIGVDVADPEAVDPKVTYLRADLSSHSCAGDGSGRLGSELAGADGIVHLAWARADSLDEPSDPEAVGRANLRTLAAVLRVAEQVRPRSLVHLSSATVYGAWADNKIPLTEDAGLRPNPEFAFAVSKAEAERVLAEWAGDHPGVHVAVLRPAPTVGPGQAPIHQALGITRSPRSGDGSRPVQYLHVEDLARAVVLAWEAGLKGAYNVAPDTGIREDDARALAGGVAKITLPSRAAASVSALGWRLWRAGVPVEARAYATHPWVIAGDRLKAAGWRPEYTSEEALVATDARVHWDDLPPGRRQNYNMAVLLIAATGVVAGVSAGVAALRSLRRRRSQG